ncbi:erythromycin esterase [Pseudonocardia ammonioxydans]|uniref:Erythromycin esterase n=1 Tax=Pseudonocardia ammonioxydans TaxID=260086 RepID=A0A1I4U1J2_PSUAM|nr:erythromycin esterase [Pseudonocardia ammonioxydans]
MGRGERGDPPPDAVSALRTLEPADPDDTDLQALARIVGDARVVCLGESAHLAHEFLQARDRLTRFLVRHLGFTVLVLESGYAEGLTLDRWVAGGPGEVTELGVHAVGHGLGDNPATRAQLGWLRDHGGVRVAGMDLPGSGTDPGPAVRECLDRVPPQPGDDELRALATLGDRAPTCPRSRALRRFRALAPADRARLVAAIRALPARAAGDPVALRCARGAALVADWLTDGPVIAPDSNPRDELMADTVLGLLDELGPHARVVVAAHDGHVQRLPVFGAPSLGTLLAPRLGGDVVVVGTTFAGGEVIELRADPDEPLVPQDAVVVPAPRAAPGSLDHLMDGFGPLHLTDLRRLPPGTTDGVDTKAFQHLTVPTAAAAFDAVLHVRAVSPEPGAADRVRAEVAHSPL